MQVVDYLNPENEPKWTLRTFGVGTSINHTSETQVAGLKERLYELAEIYNNSPLVKREGLQFNSDDFAYRLIGTTGDHAADQKKSHEILRVWRMEVILHRLGEEALFQMDVNRLLSILAPLKINQINKLGGQEAWDRLSEDEKAKTDIEIIKEVGKQVFDKLPEDEQRKLTSFVRTGCCMHKDLNCVKGGDKAMQEMWKIFNKSPPILLANKDNAAVLAHRSGMSNPTTAEIRAEEVSKRSGSHATTLGGMICRNKDKKKGQQDTYDFFMEVNVGHRVPYPDVSNTRYGSHGEAAGTIISFHSHFLLFMESVRDGKQKPGETNIEKNFTNALKDPATLTELCVLALYNVNVSRPFMQYVRSHHNILEFKDFFQKKVDFLQSVINHPQLWVSQDFSYQVSSLNGQEWDKYCTKVMESARKLAPQLQDLENAISAFVKGARDTFVDKFSDEFKEGGDIDKMTPEERQTLFFSSNNDINEGSLGRFRLGQRRRPAETLHKFNAAFMSAQNGTESFIVQKLTEEDHTYMRRKARERDANGLQKKMKMAQIKADEEKAKENRVKEAHRKEKGKTRAAIILETGKNLALTDAEIDGLSVENLNRQLDFHREAEKKSPTVTAEKIPLKSHMKNKQDRVRELKKAVARHALCHGSSNLSTQSSQAFLPTDSTAGPDDLQYESDYNDDLS